MLVDAKLIMQIFVKSFNGKTFILDVEPTETIYQIKKRIGTQEQIPAQQQRLNSSGLQLEDSTTIKDSGIDFTDPSPILQLLLRLKGRTCDIPICQHAESPILPQNGKFVVKVSICMENALIRVVKPFQSFGKFNMAKETRKSPCPICGKLCKNVKTMSIYQTIFKAVGLVQGEQKERVVRLQQWEQNEHLKFVNLEDDTLTWLYLDFEVKRL